jgi:mono/diheme cytochrome c family protein
MNRTHACWLIGCLAGALGLALFVPMHAAEVRFTTPEESKTAFEKTVQPLLARHCAGCHNATKTQGDLDLGTLEIDMKTGNSAGRWAALLERVLNKEMPPPARPQPSDEERRAIVTWIQAELKRANKSAARRIAHTNGNKVDHAALFDPKNASLPPDATPRLRRISPEIYAAFLAEMAKNVPGVDNPFSPEAGGTFKDMGAPKIDEPVTQLLIRNAIAIAERIKSKEVNTLLDESKPLTPGAIEAAVQTQYQRVLGRKANADEVKRLVELMQRTVRDAGRAKGVHYSLAAVYLLPEAVYRWETGDGKPDERGLVRLTPRAIAHALAYAVGDRRPDAKLLAEADAGKLATRDGVAAAMRRLLSDDRVAQPRLMRFFREYFGYEAAREVFKNDKDNPEHDARILVEDTDRLVEYLLQRDKNVLAELLTTNKSFVAYKNGASLKKKRDEAIAKFEREKAANPEKFKNKKMPKVGKAIHEAYNLSDFPDRQPVELPAEQRAGILTQPAWLVAFSTTDDNHAILRGKWVRERLLGGVVPDLPITVDAQLPDAPHKTLRQRMAVTQEAYCWKCHIKMNDVGLPFEMFDHFGRFRKAERVLDTEATAKNLDKKGKPLGPVYRETALDAGGLLAQVGVPGLEGKVDNAVALLHKLAKSEHVEQVFVRHAFRYWLGRNETPHDAGTLQAAHKAYRESGGSMKALLVALVTSDSFLYRAPVRAEK